ncbi:putative diphthine--ammonia ligase [Apostichopus japonicus]|uniref:Diphthine--ammonia ligase n=1 Tax=Stichopus japonicus TaxID=307972 RepID=A0A2G8LKX6_STIJA|nr:putative diphthine--ammonia ligase [Apostichopus japonicus]
MVQCILEGHEMVALANLRPVETDELDSYMFQTVGHHAIDLYAEAMDLPLFRQDITGTSVVKDKDYQPTRGDEVEDLYKLLKRIQETLDVEAVSVGAILSNYQRVRVEHVCNRLGLICLSYLWRRDQKELLEEMIHAEIEAIIIKVAALGLTSKHLGQSLSEIRPHMLKMNEKYQLNPCGEGGEYETFTLDCPLFKKRIVIDEFEVIKHDSDPFAPVSYISFKKMHLEDKINQPSVSLKDRLERLPIKKGSNLLQELGNPHLKVIKHSLRPDEEKLPQLTCDEVDNNVPEIQIKLGFDGFSWVSGILVFRRSDDSIALEAEAAFISLRDILSSNKLSLSSVVLVYINCQDLSEFSAINAAMMKFFTQNPTARVCVGANLERNIIFSMDCLVYQPSDSSRPLQRNTMHVQGISHWAPANVGPYSQSVQVGRSFYLAGMLSLCPSSMTVVEGGIHSENVLCFRSIDRVLQAMHSSLRLKDIVLTICFVTESQSIPTAKEDFARATKDTENEVDLGLHPLVCYIVINQLPRNVSVEWHVIAWLSQTRKQYHEKTIKCKDVSVDVKFLSDKISGHGIALMNVEIVDSISSLKLSPVLADLVKILSETLKETSFSWKNVLSLRLYYPHQLVKLKVISSVLCAAIRCYTDESPAVTCIPVKGLDTGQIMSLCVHLQDQGQEEEDDP